MSRTTVLAGLILMLAILAGSVYHLLQDDGSGGDADVIKAGPGAEGELDLPDPAPVKTVQFTHQTPQEKVKQKRLDEALQFIEWAKRTGERVGSFYKVEIDGQEQYVMGHLGQGVSRSGEPLYATVKARRLPMGERKGRESLTKAPEGKVVRLGGPITSLPNVSVPGKKGAAVMNYHKQGGKPAIALPKAGGGADQDG